MRRMLSHTTALVAACVAAIAAMPLQVGGQQPAVAEDPKPVTIRVGHVGHDHHLALFVAADFAEEIGKQTGVLLKPVKDRELYELYDRDRKVAVVRVVRVGGGAKMPAALAQNVIDVGFGGVAPVLGAVDKGAPVRLISPLHSRGDMLAVRPEFPAANWKEFVSCVKQSEKPVRIGYKAPVACAKLIIEEALTHAGVTFTGNLARRDVDVHMVNVKGGGKLNPALSAGLVDAYAGNNPFPAIGQEKGMLKIICELEHLPPGTFRDHPCCCIAANCKALESKSDAIACLLVLSIQATARINASLDDAVDAATHWIGTSEKVERVSIPTSGYSMADSREWHGTMGAWLKAMDGLGAFTGKLKGLDESRVAAIAYDFALLQRARKRLGD